MVLCLLKKFQVRLVTLLSEGVRRRLPLFACAPRLTPSDYGMAVLMARQIYAAPGVVGKPDQSRQRANAFPPLPFLALVPGLLVVKDPRRKRRGF